MQVLTLFVFERFMAVSTPTYENPVLKDFHEMVRDHGRSGPVTEFLKGGQLEACVMVSHASMYEHRAAEAKEHAIKRVMFNVARECPKACSGCKAMEAVGRQESSVANFEDRISVRARCTSAGYCPRAHIPVRFGLEGFEREYMTMPAPTASTPYEPAWLGEMQDVANKVLADKRYLKPQPEEAPKTKAPLVW